MSLGRILSCPPIRVVLSSKNKNLKLMGTLLLMNKKQRDPIRRV
ncbi:MAG: hypothetical protein QOK64_10445 [Nitrososphaeraceae archaeon]|nr:hypothetical protein [Nitrososphaeraceae archaeon]